MSAGVRRIGVERKRKRMNKTKIEWCDYSWNPMTGCNHGCPYCYARKIAERFKETKAFPHGFEPTFHGKRMGGPKGIKRPSKVFVCSMGDLFGEWVDKEIIKEIIGVCKGVDRHKYLFLTKNPKRYMEFEFPENCWLGRTVTGGRDGVAYALDNKQFCSFEPLLSPPYNIPLFMDWYIIGAQTNPNIQPKKYWVEWILENADRKNIPVFMKDNLDWPNKRREYPRGLMQ